MAIKHEPKFYVRLRTDKPCEFPNHFRIYPGSIYGRFVNADGKNVFWVCDKYSLTNGKLPIHIYNGIYWKFELVDKTHPCYKWVETTLKNLGKIPKVDRDNLSFDDVKNMMKHERRHKSGSGSRIYTNQINGPLRWKEVTEIAHWNGTGNASMVAANIR